MALTGEQITALVQEANSIVRGKHVRPARAFDDTSIVANNAEGPVIAAVFTLLAQQATDGSAA